MFQTEDNVFVGINGDLFITNNCMDCKGQINPAERKLRFSAHTCDVKRTGGG